VSDIHIKDYGTGKQPEGQTWDTAQMQADFEVLSFLAPWVNVKRRSDGVLGVLEFQHSPRLYFGFQELRP
jgi:hypothetical protein